MAAESCIDARFDTRVSFAQGGVGGCSHPALALAGQSIRPPRSSNPAPACRPAHDSKPGYCCTKRRWVGTLRARDKPARARIIRFERPPAGARSSRRASNARREWRGQGRSLALAVAKHASEATTTDPTHWGGGRPPPTLTHIHRVVCTALVLSHRTGGP